MSKMHFSKYKRMDEKMNNFTSKKIIFFSSNEFRIEIPL